MRISRLQRLPCPLRRLLVRSRPRFWLYLAGPVLVGLVFGAQSLSDLLAPSSLLLFGYFLLPANVFLYGINDVFDADVDRDNPKKDGPEIRYRGESVTRAAVLASVLLGGAVVLSLPIAAAPWLLGFFLLGTAYSAPPLRLKTRPPLDSLSNGLYVLPGVAAYAALAGNLPPLAVLLGAWLWTMGMHTFSAVPDIAPDRSAGIRTTATVLGRDRTLGYCFACWTAAALLVGATDVRAAVLFACYPALCAGIWLSDVDVSRAYWWYPVINTALGMVLTLAGLWGIRYG